MSILRTVKCPACGRTRLLGRVCPCGGRGTSERRSNRGTRVIGLLLTFVLTAGGIVAASLALAATKGTGYGIALAVGAWLLLHLCRLGYDWEDGIDIRERLLPGPLDWPVKLESVRNLFHSGRAYFAAAYIGVIVALGVTIIVLLGDGRGVG